MNDAKTSRGGRQVALGFGLAFLLHLLQIPLTLGLWRLNVSIESTFGSLVNFPFVFIGGTQLVYLIPAALIARLKGKPGLMKGLLIGGALTLLLNGLCFGLFASGAFGRIAG